MPEDHDSEPAILFQSVRFAYGKGPTILDIQDLRIARGESIFLHGPSGSGKTTLLSLMAGILSPASGSIHVLGHDLARISAAARDTLRGSQMGYIFQNFNLVPYLSVQQNIELPCRLHPQRRRKIQSANLQQEVERLAERLDIQSYLDAPVTRLSVGQQQRVAIARAVIGSPALLIADEPTSSLDTDRRDAFLDLLTSITQEARNFGIPATLLFVSHDHTLAPHFDRTISLRDINRSAAAATVKA